MSDLRGFDVGTTNSVLEIARADHRYRANLRNIGHIVDIDELVVDLEEACDFTPREKNIMHAWVSEGVRFDTNLWMKSMMIHWDDKNLDNHRAIVSAFFIDTYNRADDVFDTFRQKFVTQGSLTVGSMSSVPILETDDGAATVGDFTQMLTKMVNKSDVYGDKEKVALSVNFRRFFEVTTTAMQQYEQTEGNSVRYGLKEALALRFQTLHPLVLFACDLYENPNLAEAEKVKIREEMVALAMAAQWLDDRNDWREDFKNGNTNMVVGIMADAFGDEQSGPSLTPRDVSFLTGESRMTQGEGQNRWKTEAAIERVMQEEYSRQYNRLHPLQQQFMPEDIGL